ncbi:transposase InsI for insertion sequence element IS30B/C/D [Escherichia coli PA7]|nr:transposase InsI for insertion sequence element IS30B/C/D [Escherichia coli PA7]
MAKRPKPCLLDQNLPLRKLVLEKLEMKWSPVANIRMVKAEQNQRQKTTANIT